MNADGPADEPLSREDRELGMSRDITRRDLLGGSVLGAGMALLSKAAPAAAYGPAGHEAAAAAVSGNVDFNGYGGIGDYAGSNGNTWEVIQSAHRIRDGVIDERQMDAAIPTDESFDVVIVGAGGAGLSAAYHFTMETFRRGKCLILDNHPVFGGEAKQNEFEVDGHRLIGPQGSNLFSNAPEPTDGQMYAELRGIGMPTKFEYAALEGTRKPLQFDFSNYMFQWIADEFDSNGFFFGRDGQSGYVMERNAWASRFANAPLPEAVKRDLLKWKYETTRPDDETIARLSGGKSFDRWMDSITYEHYVTQVLKLDPAVASWADPHMASGSGLGCSTASAYAAVNFLYMPGARRPGDPLREFNVEKFLAGRSSTCFPGGNAGIARYFINHLIPSAFADPSPEKVLTGSIDFAALDKPDQPVRFRGSATVVRVRHVQPAGQKAKVEVIYAKDGRLYRIVAPNVIMCGGGWVNRRVVTDLPATHREAYDKFDYSSMVVANVALRDWRFMERAGITSCVYTHGDFGFSCNIRRPMHVGGFRPPLDPGKPTVLTFYAPIIYPEMPAKAQGARGRAELYATSYRQIEQRIRRQMVRLFSKHGFEPGRDIAGIIVNRWGHAYNVSAPGMSVGDDANPTPGDVLRRGHGLIGFAHSDLSGFQAFTRAVREGRRAARQVLKAV
jgi:spermidine dehydrogenase